MFEFQELAPDADFRVILTAERAGRIAESWVVNEIGRATSFFTRDGQRVEVDMSR